MAGGAAAATPSRVPLGTLAPDMMRLEAEVKQITHAIRMAAYNAETTLARALDGRYARAGDEACALIREDLNRFLRGWAAYYRFGNSADRFGKISEYARMRMALFLAKRARRSRKFGWAVLTCRSPDQLGLITLSGIVVAPYPFKDWRVKPNAAGERRR